MPSTSCKDSAAIPSDIGSHERIRRLRQTLTDRRLSLAGCFGEFQRMATSVGLGTHCLHSATTALTWITNLPSSVAHWLSAVAITVLVRLAIEAGLMAVTAYLACCWALPSVSKYC